MCVQCMRGWGACVCNMVWRVWMCVEGVWMERWSGGGVWGFVGGGVVRMCLWRASGGGVCIVMCMKVGVGAEGIQVGGVCREFVWRGV